MPVVRFGTKDQPGFDLSESPNLIAVRTRSRRSVRGAGPVRPPAAAEVADGALVAAFPDAGVEVYEVPPAARTIDDRKRTLRGEPDVRFAGAVLVRPETNEPVVYTENVYIRFKPEVDEEDCEEIIRSAGLVVRRRLDFAANAFFASAPEGTGQRIFEIAESLLERSDVVYCHPELIERRERKAIFPRQWHLKATEIAGVAINAHANVEAAHAFARGQGIVIAVIDDGVDIDHPEFAAAGKIVAPRDATRHTDDPRPKDEFPFTDDHGTACAGVACAAGSTGASGVAPEARLMPIRLASGLGSIEEAEAFRWAADNGADVISCSWGPADGKWYDASDPVHSRATPIRASTRDALEYAFTNGRGGKGCIVCFAAGNGNESVDLDGYASYPKVIAVAACNDTSKRSIYSDFGKAVWCAFPSNDFGRGTHPDPITTGIWTTDRRGASGYNPGDSQSGGADRPGDFCEDFGGTSSACPGVAGVAALVLSANGSLRWNEVKDLIRRSCAPIDPAGGEYDSEGRSKYYGFGRVDALAAVKLARSADGRVTVVNKRLMAPIPDLGRVQGTIELVDPAPVDKLAFSVKLRHTYVGDLLITVVPPTGRGLPKVVLHNRAGAGKDDLEMTYDSANVPGLAAYSGKRCDGVWTILVEDKAAQDSGTLEEIGVSQRLPPETPAPPRLVETPRFAAAPPAPANANGHRTVRRRRTVVRRTS
ncbi:MAG TPA: S8 family serine peptidase [Planctomycetia bacterium]|nr:S8 family serine peptidase [Planctomycetia bacterium]